MRKNEALINPTDKYLRRQIDTSRRWGDLMMYLFISCLLLFMFVQDTYFLGLAAFSLFIRSDYKSIEMRAKIRLEIRGSENGTRRKTNPLS